MASEPTATTCDCGHPQGWHRKNVGACIECGCTYFDDRDDAAVDRSAATPSVPGHPETAPSDTECFCAACCAAHSKSVAHPQEQKLDLATIRRWRSEAITAPAQDRLCGIHVAR